MKAKDNRFRITIDSEKEGELYSLLKSIPTQVRNRIILTALKKYAHGAGIEVFRALDITVTSSEKERHSIVAASESFKIDTESVQEKNQIQGNDSTVIANNIIKSFQ